MTLVQVQLLDNLYIQNAVSCGFVVEEKLIVAHRDNIPWAANNAFDQKLFVFWRIECNNLSWRWIRPGLHLPAGERYLQVVGELVDDNPVPFEYCWFHRSRRDLVPISDC